MFVLRQGFPWPVLGCARVTAQMDRTTLPPRCSCSVEMIIPPDPLSLSRAMSLPWGQCWQPKMGKESILPGRNSMVAHLQRPLCVWLDSSCHPSHIWRSLGKENRMQQPVTTSRRPRPTPTSRSCMNSVNPRRDSHTRITLFHHAPWPTT